MKERHKRKEMYSFILVSHIDNRSRQFTLSAFCLRLLGGLLVILCIGLGFIIYLLATGEYREYQLQVQLKQQEERLLALEEENARLVADGEKLTQLVLGLHPEADSMTIVTDEQLFADLKGLMATAENLLNQLAEEAQMPKEELAKMLTLIREQEGGAAESPLVQEKPMDEPQDTMKLTETVEPRVEVETESVPMAKTLSGEGQELQTAETVTKAPDTQSERSQNKPEGGSTDNNRQQAGESFTTNLLNQLSEAVEEAGKSEGSYGVSGQDIINQITEQIKVSIKADTTEMELQLNPASLGSLKVQIASKAGVLTATFITQNEAVKAALEGQMVQLKENFEQQGLKVEAVEVNVEARGFERSLDQQDREQSSFQEQTKKNGRRINLLGSEGSEEDLLSEDLSEEDRIVADMMLRNGNTVDYTA